MATLSEVLQSVVTKIAGNKPDGYSTKYFQGFPLPERLKDDLSKDKHNISVFPYNISKRVPAYLLDPIEYVVSEEDEQYTILSEKGRQIRGVQIHIWAKSATARDDIGESIKLALDETPFLPLPDNQSGRLLYVSDIEDDMEQAAGIYHRTYIYTVEYATTRKTTVAGACEPRILNRDGEVVEPGSNTSVLVDDIT